MWPIFKTRNFSYQWKHKSYATILFDEVTHLSNLDIRKIPLRASLMTMSPSYPCGKPFPRGTRNETVKNLTLFSSIFNGIMMESRL